MIGLTHYLVVGAILFVAGVFGIFVNRKNVIVILMSIELILLSVNINFVAFSAHLGDLAGQVFTMFILTVAAAEAAIGLAILVVFRDLVIVGGVLVLWVLGEAPKIRPRSSRASSMSFMPGALRAKWSLPK
mgnify:CR=1 FL=1